MALINTLRNKMGKIVVAVIAFSILAFIAGDLLGPNSVLLGGNQTNVGEINGQTISLQEYQFKIDEMARNYAIQYGQSPSGDAMFTVRQQAWDALINEKAFYTYYEDLGVIVSEDEEVDLTYGSNVDPLIQRSFADPNTGAFDSDRVVEFLQNWDQMNPQFQAQWLTLSKTINETRKKSKFDNLFLKANYVTTAEAQEEYNQSSKTASVKYVYVPFSSIPDSTINVTKGMMEDYLDDNEKEYQEEEYRSLAFIAFPLEPSADDTLAVLDEMQELKNSLANAQNDSLFAIANSDGTAPFLSYRADLLPQPVQDQLADLAEGDVVGPEFFNGKYVVYKLSGIESGEQPSARASHILFTADDDSDASKSDARRRANDVLRQIKSGADFAEMARIHGTDGTAQSGGDLGWFSEGRMVKPFQDAVFNATRKGLLPNLVETDFGFHIIDVTEVMTTTAYKLASVEREVTASDDTRDAAYREASLFVAQTSDWEEFQSNAQEQGLQLQTAPKVRKNDRRVSNLSNARGIVTWLYNTASTGDIYQDVFELEDQYVVAIMTGHQPAGKAKLTAVEARITSKVRNEKKAEEIVSKLSSLSGSVDDIASSYGPAAKVNSMTNLKLSSNSLTSVGLASNAVGIIFGTEAGATTAPIVADNGVLVVSVESFAVPTAIEDFSTYKNQLAQRRLSRISYGLGEAIKESADIEDERFRFF
ncbi:MAG: SurA N-terminal domain-containing protein [Cyclobacteriaceae bacterium]